jgi:hypothetical protein
LESADVGTVVEVGGEDGVFTQKLITWAEAHDVRAYCVEPEPTPSLVEVCEHSEVARLVKGRSPEALLEIEACDAYLLDGDHNYFTTLGELEVIYRTTDSGRAPLVLLHDVGWPCGRRDMYYAPEALPPHAVWPYTYEKGVTLTSPGVITGGFRGEGRHAFAVQEGGP